MKKLAAKQLITWLSVGLTLLFFSGCSTTSETDQEENPFQRQIGQHFEETGEGQVVTNIIEERRGGLYIIRIEVIKNGEKSSITKTFDSYNFSVKIPVGARVMVQSAEEAAVTSPDTGIVVFSQKLEVAREAMLKTDYVTALEAVNEALKVDSYNPQAHMMKGSIFYAMGKYDLAKKEFEFVLKVDPDNIEVKRFKDFMESKSDNQKVKIEGIEGQ